MAEQAPLGVYGTLANARIAQRQEAETAAKEQLRALVPTLVASDDAQEGLLAILVRRPGRFNGS